MVIVKLINCKDKVLFERVINSPLEEIPFSKIIDVLRFLYPVPCDIVFIVQDTNCLNL